MTDENETAAVTGQCYCGASSLEAANFPNTIVYCHCKDCRRLSGAPVAAFAAFHEEDLKLHSDTRFYQSDVVSRQFCAACGSQLTAGFKYLPGQVFVPLGILDQADLLEPKLHCHADQTLPWLNLEDDLPRIADSARREIRSKA